MPAVPRDVPERLPPEVRDRLLRCVALHPADRPGLAEVRAVLTRA
jgi:hypothetical protein